MRNEENNCHFCYCFPHCLPAMTRLIYIREKVNIRKESFVISYCQTKVESISLRLNKGNPEELKNVLNYSFSFETSQFAGGGTRAFDENEDIPNPRVFRDSGSLDNSLHLLKDEKIDVTVKWGEQIEAFTLTTNKE